MLHSAFASWVRWIYLHLRYTDKSHGRACALPAGAGGAGNVGHANVQDRSMAMASDVFLVRKNRPGYEQGEGKRKILHVF